MASSKLLLCLLVVTVLQFVNVQAGQRCSQQEQCCKDEETCCQDGCCGSEYPVCCSQYSQCCPSAYPVCCPGRRCCSSAYPVCCPGQSCCPSTHRHCCSDGGCCQSGYPVCCGTHCCRSGSTCCSQGCCAIRTGRSTRSAPIFVPSKEELMVHSTEAADRVGTEEQMDHYVEASLAAHSVSSRSVSLSGPCNSYERERLNEGYFTHVYLDPVGIRTIGVGFNLEKAGARQQIERVGADYDEVLNGNQDLTDSQIETLFNEDMNTAVSCVTSWLPQWRLILGLAPQSALADMAFNLGCNGLMGFRCLRDALSRSPPDRDWAADEMRDSRWCGQVGLRCDRDVACMLQD